MNSQPVPSFFQEASPREAPACRDAAGAGSHTCTSAGSFLHRVSLLGAVGWAACSETENSDGFVLKLPKIWGKTEILFAFKPNCCQRAAHSIPLVPNVSTERGAFFGILLPQSSPWSSCPCLGKGHPKPRKMGKSGQENRTQGEKEMHRHLLVFIPPVITVPWHGDSTGGEGHSTEHGTTTARRAGGRGDIPSSLCSSPGRNKARIPSQERGTPLLRGRAAAGSAQHRGGVLFLSGVNSGFSTPLPHRDERDRIAGPSRLAPSEGPSRARGSVFLAGMGCRFSGGGYGTRGGGCSTPCLVLARQIAASRSFLGGGVERWRGRATTPRSMAPQGHSPALEPPGRWRRAPPAGARGGGYGGDMLALGSNLSPEDGTKTTHQGQLGQGLEGGHTAQEDPSDTRQG